MPKFVDSAVQRLAGLQPFPQPPIIPVHQPVVLMHGFGMLAGVQRGGHLHEEALHLRQHGVRAYAPNVAPYNTIRVRAEMWKQRIEHILEETNTDTVHLIAHSMGGLDARYLISELAMHDVVTSLITVATPHRGTSIATLFQEQPEQFRAWTTTIVNWMGTMTLDDASADLAQAVRQLTPEYVCDTFNPSVPDHPSVTYGSYAGRAGKGTDVPISPLLRPLNVALYRREGPNDGYVSVESAQWGTPLGTINADHLQQVGLQLIPGREFDTDRFYRSIVERLADQDL